MKLTKMHGLGNDFILANNLERTITDHAGLAKRVCDRNFGLGADGLITVEKPSSNEYSFRMKIMNSDGSEAEMCGNGIRCFAKYLIDEGIIKNTYSLKVETLAGKIQPWVMDHSKDAAMVRVDMGIPKLNASQIPTTIVRDDSKVVNHYFSDDPNIMYLTTVSMGNPHVVFIKEGVSAKDLDFLVSKYGKNIESDISIFPKKTNVEFVNVNDRHDITMRVYERGCGPTLACGTGACASVVATVLNDKTGRDVLVHLLGGDLKIKWDNKNNHIYMTGPAETVFSTNDYKI